MAPIGSRDGVAAAEGGAAVEAEAVAGGDEISVSRATAMAGMGGGDEGLTE
jgi:hypothetical protein